MAKSVRASAPSRGAKKEKVGSAPAASKKATATKGKAVSPKKTVKGKAPVLKAEVKPAAKKATTSAQKTAPKVAVKPVVKATPKPVAKASASKAAARPVVKADAKPTGKKKAVVPVPAAKPAKKVATKPVKKTATKAKEAATAPKTAPRPAPKATKKAKVAAPKPVAKPAKKPVVKKETPAPKKAVAKAKAPAKKAVVKEKEVKVVVPVQHHVPPYLPNGPIRVLVTQARPEGEKSPYYDLAKKYDLNLEFHPFIRVEGLTGKEFRRQRVDLKEYTAIVFTSRLAVDHFFRIMEEMKAKVNPDLKYFCITEAVALYLQKFILYRKRKVFFSADGSTQGLLDVIGKHKNEKYVVPMSDSTKKEIPAFMAKMKIPHAEASLYRTVSNDLTALARNSYDMIVFFSPYSIQALLEHEPTYKQNGTVMGAFGPTTTKAVEDAGFRLDIKAPAINAPSMTSAMELFLAEQTVSQNRKEAVKK